MTERRTVPPSFTIVVPSHGRSGSIQDRTLRMLAARGLRATVVVSQADLYDYVDALPGWDVREGLPGLVGNRNAIASMFPRDTRVLSIDDDVSDVVVSTGVDGRLRSLTADEFVELAERAFNLLDRYRGAIWGLNPSADRRFLANAPAFTVGISAVEACLFGFVSGRTDLTLPPSAFSGAFDDMERICKVWTAGWNVIRVSQVGYLQSQSGAGGKGAAERANLCDEVGRVVRQYPLVATHTFGKLPNQSKCRVNIRRRCSVANPACLAEVEELRQRILDGPMPPLPPLHDVSYVPDVEGRATETAAALGKLNQVVLAFLSEPVGLNLCDVEMAALIYLGGGGSSADADALRLAIQRAYTAGFRGGPKYAPERVKDLRRAADKVRAAGKLMKWDIRERKL